MTILFVLLVAVVLLIMLACCKVSGDCARAEEMLEARMAAMKDPCETCLRWSECNGVDEQCPHRKGNTQNEQD